MHRVLRRLELQDSALSRTCAKCGDATIDVRDFRVDAMTSDAPQSSIVLYRTEDGRTRIQCRFEDETIWLTQAQIAELFQVTPQNVTLHLKSIFDDGELTEAATCKDYLQVRREEGFLSPAKAGSQIYPLR